MGVDKDGGLLVLIILCLSVSIVSADSFSYSFNATSPSYDLINGSLLNDASINDYESKIDISAGLSDDSDSTKYLTTIGQTPNTEYYYMFNDYNLNYAHDSSGNGNYLSLMPNSFIDANIDIYSLKVNTTTGSYASSVSKPEFNIHAGNYTLGLIINFTNLTTSFQYLFRHYLTTGSYIYLTSGKVYAIIRDDSLGYASLMGTTVLNTSIPHTIIIRRDTTANRHELIVDDVLEANTTTAMDSISNYANLDVGSYYGGYSINGWIDEVFMIEEYLTDSQLTSYYNNLRLYDEDFGSSINVFFNHTINSSRFHSLKIKKTTPDEDVIRIYSSINMTDINMTDYIDKTLTQGENYISIQNLVYDGYNYPFRIGGLHDGINISEIELIEIGNDTEVPVVNSVTISDNNISCSDNEIIIANVTDDSYVESVSSLWGYPGVLNFTINLYHDSGDIWSANLTNETLRLIFESQNWSFSTPINISLFSITSTDITNKSNTQSNIDVWGYYWCLDCHENWIANNTECYANNTFQYLFYDSSSCGTTFDLPATNGTYGSCNFCDPVLRKEYVTECYNNGTYDLRNYTTIDDNYYGCCVLSEVPTEDCPTDYAPYNDTQTEYCSLAINDFDVDYDSEVYFGLIPDRVYWKIYINQTNKTFKCLSYVKTHQQNMLQSNPQYTAQSDTLIRVRQTEYEDREFFNIENGIGNIYFTKENLVIDGRTYIFGVECSDGQGTRLISERFVKALYEPVNEPITRFIWVKENMFGLITLLMLSIVFGLAITFWWRVRK